MEEQQKRTTTTERLKQWLFAVLSAVGMLALGVWFWRARKGTSLSASIETQKRLRKLAEAKAERDDVAAGIKAREPEVAALDDRIREHKRRIVELNDTQPRSEEEIEDAFDRLGF